MSAKVQAAAMKITITATMSFHLSWTPCRATGPNVAGRWPTWRALEHRGLVVMARRRKGAPSHWHKTRLGLRVHQAIKRLARENGLQETYTVTVTP